MKTFSRILFHMDTVKADLFYFIVDTNPYLTTHANWCSMLGDLISFRKIRIEIIFACKIIVPGDIAIAGKANPDGKIDRLIIQLRKRSRVRKGNWADMRIRVSPKSRAIATEEFAFSEQLGVDFEANDGFV